MFYNLLRNLLFKFDPEKVHYFSMHALQKICAVPAGKALVTKLFTPKNNPISFLGIQFKNKVGLAAGFDKNAMFLNELEALGFGHVEIGTVTPLAQDGNDKPRLFRLPKDKALINRMGFNNNGLANVVQRLKSWQQKNTNNPNPIIIGGNIGKNKLTPNQNAWQDYETCFLGLHPFVDYFVVNVSSPNTPGLRELQEKDALNKILTHLQQLNKQQQKQKPILLKIAPDLSPEQLNDVADLAVQINLDGLVISNTTLDRTKLTTSKETVENIGAGGLSGMPVKTLSTEIIQYLHQKTNGTIPIIGSGGIFTAVDAQQKINAGATLIQVWTGFVYQGPSIVKQLCKSI
jgi:dihydroorotate dehydrogenase